MSSLLCSLLFVGICQSRALVYQAEIQGIGSSTYILSALQTDNVLTCTRACISDINCRAEAFHVANKSCILVGGGSTGSGSVYIDPTDAAWFTYVKASAYSKVCDESTGWYRFDNACYSVPLLSVNWTDSEEYCLTQNSHLATVTSEDEQNFVLDLVYDTFQSRGWNDTIMSAIFIWLGANTVEVGGIYRWVTGEPWGYNNWEQNEPSVYGWFTNAENCLSMYPVVGFQPGQWNDMTCWSSFSFVCERNL